MLAVQKGVVLPRDFSASTFVFVSSRTGPTMGRIERRLLRVIEALIERGAVIHLICTPRHPLATEAAAMGAEVAPYHLDKFNFLRTRSRLRKYLQRSGPVVVHSTGLQADLLSRWAAKNLPTAAVNSIACVAWPRQGKGPVSTAIRRYLDRNTASGVDLFVVDSESLQQPLAELGIPADRILLDRPSIDLAEVFAQAEQPVALPQRPAGPLVGYAGRMEPARGLEHLVTASAILEAGGAIAQVVIAGDGPLLAELKRDNRSSRVRYLGYVPSVPAVLKNLEVAVFPSTGRGVPTALIEAAALARPIVASRVEGIEELFEDGSEIILVPPGDPRALAHAIADMLASPKASHEMGERARLRVLDSYSSAASIERHLEAYSGLMWD